MMIEKYPALRSAYDYYPFGMLMPDRYVSDTSGHCVTVTRPTWSWKWVISNCHDVYGWVWYNYLKIGRGTATKVDDAIKIDLPAATDGVSFDISVTPHVAQQLQIGVKRLELNKGGYIQLLEQNGEDWKKMAEVPVKDGQSMVIPFTPNGNIIRIKFWGMLRIYLYTICDASRQLVEEDQLMTICDGDKDKYRFGYQKQEKDNEIAGIGNHYDFKFRGYAPRIGRFWGADPLHKKYPWNSDYAFAENDVIRCVDLEGLEKVDVVTTSFAPFNLFGSDGFGSFSGDGDGRQFGLELNKYRTSGSVKLDLANSKYISKWAGFSISTYHRNSHLLFDDYVAKSPSETKVNGLNLKNNFVGASFSVAGKNHAAIISCDIDANVSIGFQKITDNKFRVFGTVNGDRFPANETYLRDESNNILMLGVSGINSENKNTAPYTEIPRDNKRRMSSFDINVIFEGEKNNKIKGVETNDGKFIDRETWNQQFQKLNPKSSKTGTHSH